MPKIRSNLCVPLEALKKVGNVEEKMEIGEERNLEKFRDLCVKCGVFGAKDGSGYAEFGNTMVLAQINGPDGDGKWEENYAKITISLKGVDEQKNAQYRGQITSAISAIIFANKYPGKVIDIEVTVLADDGGILAASLVAASLALAHSGIENMGLMSAAHIGLTKSGKYITDPNIEEIDKNEIIGGITLAIVPNINQITCTDIYGRIPLPKIPDLLEFSKNRAISIIPTLHKAVLNSVKEK
ncbi:unnamed protein product [Caenorhabditis angaria]|uniref:Exoribonuclease phosphorolytic domain-containing protein n=1 Tax=Caenorhabditis angaria TaxID=860376 RepID=A0A9P1IHK2_9PELO|nr:unnamed protein product [Caenorhabditis angaria]